MVRTCAIVARDSTVAIGYTCDVVWLMLRPAVPTQAISGLLTDVSGTVGRVFNGPYINSVEIRVPARTELAAIRRAFTDSNVVRARLPLELVGAF